MSASDGYGDDASQVVSDTVQNFSDLPSPAINNMIVEITGDATNSFDNYYVKFFLYHIKNKYSDKPEIAIAV